MPQPVSFPKLVSLVLTLFYHLPETHRILSPPCKKFLKSIALTPPLSSRSSLPAFWVFHGCHQHLKFNTLRNKMWLSPHLYPLAYTSVSCSSLTFQIGGKAAGSLFFMFMGMLHLPQYSVLWLSSLGGSLDVTTLCIQDEKFANEARGKRYASRRRHQSLLESALPSTAPKCIGSYICLVHQSSLQGSGLVCCSFRKEKAWPLTPCHLHFISFARIDGLCLYSLFQFFV